MTPQLSIIIPCFNEIKNIRPLLVQMQDIVNKSQLIIEVIVIDGGSTDNTQKELKEIFSYLPHDIFKLILRKKKKGYGYDINKALNCAKGNILSWTHADMQTDPNDIIEAYNLYINCRSKKIIVKGKRKNRNFLDVFFTFGMQIVVYIFLRQKLDDINAQPKLFSREFYISYINKNAPFDFSLDLFLLHQAKINDFKIKEIPVFFKDRIHGEAKGGGTLKGKINLVIRTFKYILKLKKHL